jgi:hypothetical protein
VFPSLNKEIIMTITRILLAALVAGAATLASAQPTPAAQAASKPSDCGKARHDHGAEKNTPRAKSAGCDTGTVERKKVHDHGKVHK